MTIQEFIEENRVFIIQSIKAVCDNCDDSDDALEGWVLNGEGLYNWALSHDVDL